MKIPALHRFLLCAFVATALSLSARAQTQAGQILAAKVEGEVLKVALDGTTTPLANGEKLTETDTITTGKNSGVVLVFMNGSSVKLGPDSRLAIEQFKMDPLAEDVEVGKLQAEPSVSQTALNLTYGEMVGDVKKLNTSSSYTIKTPVGAAGIRGTIYRIVFRPSSDGKAFFTVSTAEGRVVMEGVSAQEIPVPEGQEVVVEIDVPDTPGEAPAAPVIVTQDIPAETKTAIQAEAAVIQQTVQETTFTPTPTTTTPTTPTETPAEEETEEETPPAETPTAPTPETPTTTTSTPETPTTPTPTPTPTTPTPPAPLPPTPPPPPLTPGAGK
jgi:hypothetical protein